MFKIEKGVERATSGREKYPFAKMEVGDSFLVPAELRRKVEMSAYQAGKRGVGKFSVRSVDGGVRVWRIA